MATSHAALTPMNRWAVPAVLLALFGAGGRLVVSVMDEAGLTGWLMSSSADMVHVFRLVRNTISVVIEFLVTGALVLGTTAAVQVSASQGRQRGRGLGVVAVVLCVAAELLSGLVHISVGIARILGGD